MKKIENIFLRGDDGILLFEPNPKCDWVFKGEGRATEKLDGTACMIHFDGNEHKLYKRLEIKEGKENKVYPGFISAYEEGEESPKKVGWVPCDPDDPADKYHFEGFSDLKSKGELINELGRKTYELCGPKIQKNPMKIPSHVLFLHGQRDIKNYFSIENATSKLELITSWNQYLLCMPAIEYDITEHTDDYVPEGIVWHHPDGRMAKIKLIDLQNVRKKLFLRFMENYESYKSYFR